LTTDRPIIVFGSGSFASLAAHVLTHDAQRRVLGFTVDVAHLHSATHDGLPVYPFETLVEHAPPPADCQILVALGYLQINGLRQARCAAAEAMGYELTRYISRYARIAAGTPIGRNSQIYENVILQPHVRLGADVIVRAGANIGHHSTVGDHSFIASGAVTGGNVSIGQRCFIGLGAIIRDGVRLGDRCFIGAGAVVTGDIEADAVYVGNPARRIAKTSLEVTP
jgi:sugar O-acyltransferase (sialic acid O-acetyltransferase NeuD family)